MVSDMINIDIKWLKKNTTRPPIWFGIGCYQLYLPDNSRIHFWHEDHPINIGNENEAHNHRYNFQSKVLKGTMINEIWEPSYELLGEWAIWNVSCDPRDENESYFKNYVNVETKQSTYYENDEYTMESKEFHRSLPQGMTITHFKRQYTTNSNYAEVIMPKKKLPKCPFQNSLSQRKIWQHIKEVIDG